MLRTRWATGLAAAVTAGGLLLAVPTVQAQPSTTFQDVCERYGGTCTHTPDEPATYQCEDVYLKLVKPPTPKVTFAGPFTAFQRSVPDGYSCFPGEVGQSGWFEYVACTIPSLT
jgi:hypothetical protein